jgi:hypothetical protein
LCTITGDVSEKTDAFAFGIVMVEVLTEYRPDKARELVDKMSGNDLADELLVLSVALAVGLVESLGFDSDSISARSHEELVDLAVACVHPQSDKRSLITETVTAMERLEFGEAGLGSSVASTTRNCFRTPDSVS